MEKIFENFYYSNFFTRN